MSIIFGMVSLASPQFVCNAWPSSLFSFTLADSKESFKANLSVTPKTVVYRFSVNLLQGGCSQWSYQTTVRSCELTSSSEP